MRIALVNISLDPARGSDLVTLELAKRLAENHVVTLVSFRRTDVSEEGIRIISPSSWKVRDLVEFWQTVRDGLRSSDVVNSHHAIVSLLLPKKRLVTTYHGFRGRLNLRFGPTVGECVSRFVRRWVIRPALRSSRAVVLVSRSLMPEVSGLDLQELRVIYNGVDEPLSGISPGPLEHFLYVGRLDPDKNVGELLGTYLATEGLPPLLLAGDGSERQRLETEFSDDRIRFLGRIGRNELEALYSRSYAFVTASTFETFCLPVIEAAHHGCPSIGVRSGSLPEVVLDRETGWLVDDFASEAGRALRAAVDMDAGMRAPMVERCQRWATGFSWRVAVEQYTDLYSEVA